MFNFFKSKREKELLEEQKSLEEVKELLEKELRKAEIRFKCENDLIINKEVQLKNQNWEEFDKKLKKYHYENNQLKSELKEVEKIVPIFSLNYNYLVKLEKYFIEPKFKHMIATLKLKGIKYVQDLNEITIEQLFIEEEIKIEGKKKYNKFVNFEIPWKIKTYLVKGEKLTKLYVKNRKFINRLSEINIEYVSDLENYNFDNLKEIYTKEEIEELKKIYMSYLEEQRVNTLSEREE